MPLAEVYVLRDSVYIDIHAMSRREVYREESNLTVARDCRVEKKQGAGSDG